VLLLLLDVLLLLLLLHHLLHRVRMRRMVLRHHGSMLLLPHLRAYWPLVLPQLYGCRTSAHACNTCQLDALLNSLAALTHTLHGGRRLKVGG
jgi:hypothetical protein